jgi:uncharacterized RDD family membrane protein YckC
MKIVYPSILRRYFSTLGQKITGIRVRSLEDNHNISLIRAYVRIVVKLFLGIISFFTIPFSKKKRAIHDMAVGSLVAFKRG